TVTITGTNNISVISGTTTGSVTEDGVLSFSGTLTITDIDTSDPTDFVDVAATAGDNGFGSFEMTANTWTYLLDNTDPVVQALDVGETLSDTFTFTAPDGETRIVTVTIVGTEDAPVFNSTPVLAATEDATYSYTITASDIDIEAITITATTLPSWLTLTNNGDGTVTLSGTPLNADVDHHAVILNASDGSLGSNQSFTIVVANTNDAPEGSVTINNISPTEGDILIVSNNLTDVDGLSGAITYQWQRAGVDIIGATGSTYTTVQADAGSQLTVIARFTDNQGTAEQVSSTGTAAVIPASTNTLIDSDPDDGTSDPDPDNNFVTEQPPIDATEETVLTDDEIAPQLEESLIAIENDESLILTETQGTAENTEGFLYLTDKDDSDTESNRHSFIYFDNEETSARNLLDDNYKVNQSTFNTNIFSVSDDIDFENNDLQKIIKNGDYDLLRDEIDEAFSAEQRSESVRAKVVTASAATFTVGLVSYLLRASSLIVSMMSTLPLWRGFDPIAIVAGKKKKTDKQEVTDSTVTKSETLFDGESE
ncbi:MAG: VCBS domain-containing protein, partial [Deltaproteobacteria bacterium]|nr:VCBS domain-containing protein [Deltaproteobacteria bacterium]